MTDDLRDEWGLPLWPAAERNKEPILEALQRLLPKAGGTILEIASGTGQHAIHFAAALAHFVYQPTECDVVHLETLRMRMERSGLGNLRPPVRLDVREDAWLVDAADVIYNANMVHIAPLAAAEGLFRGAGAQLRAGGLLLTYGPYKFDGQHTSESNARFDESLRGRSSEWGVRDVSELERLALPFGLQYRRAVALPANNFLLVWDKS